MLGEISADDILKQFSYFFQQTGFDILCELFLKETVCMNEFIFWEKQETDNKQCLLDTPPPPAETKT